MTWMDWYGSLAKPSWTPAPSTISLIWTVLYPVIPVSFGFVFVKAFRRKLPRSVALPFASNLVAASTTSNLDPELNRMAVTIPRIGEAFDVHWAKVLDDPENTTRAVLLDGELVGGISCFPRNGKDQIGYFIDRARWGMGIASRALHLLLGEVTKRPMFATAATSNGASVRVLQKCGFVVEAVRLSPASDR